MWRSRGVDWQAVERARKRVAKSRERKRDKKRERKEKTKGVRLVVRRGELQEDDGSERFLDGIAYHRFCHYVSHYTRYVVGEKERDRERERGTYGFSESAFATARRCWRNGERFSSAMRDVVGLNCDFNGSALDRGVASARRRGGEHPAHRWYLPHRWRGRLARRSGESDLILLSSRNSGRLKRKYCKTPTVILIRLSWNI